MARDAASYTAADEAAAPIDETQAEVSVVEVEIVSGHKQRSFMTFPLECLLAREQEMQDVAELFQIDPASWNGSRLYKMHTTRQTTEFVIHPERDCAIQNYSHSLQWQEWLTKLMQHYFRTGNLCIPNHSRGNDLLLALEYFGILYRPDQLQFASYPTYARVKHWSDYFTHRTSMGDYVADHILQQVNGTILFSTSLNPADTLHLDRQPVHVLLSGNPSSGESQSSVASAATVYDFFNVSLPEEDSAYVDRTEAAAMMRQDFSDYVQHILTDIQATFTILPVQSVKGIDERAVLRVHILSRPSGPPIQHTKSEASAPLDEAMYRLKEKQRREDDERLERLMRKLDDDSSPKRVCGFPSSDTGSKYYKDFAGPENECAPAEEKACDAAALQAPVSVIRTVSGQQTVISALTLPPSLQNDPAANASLKAEEKKKERRSSKKDRSKQNWIQSELFQNGISDRIGALLQSSDRQSDPEGTSAEKQSPKMRSIQDSFEWFAGLGLCEYPASVIKEVGNFQVDTACSITDIQGDNVQGGQLHPVPEANKSATASKVEKEPNQAGTPRRETSVAAVTVSDRIKSVSHPAGVSSSHPVMPSAPEGSEIHVDRRSLGLSEERQSIAVSEDHDCREADTGFEISHSEPQKLVSVCEKIEAEDQTESVISDISPITTETKVYPSVVKKEPPRKTTKRGGIKGLFRRRKAAV